MNELIEKQKKELNDILLEAQAEHGDGYLKEVYNWHINSIKEILEAEVETLKQEVQSYVCKNEDYLHFEKGYQSCIKDQIEHLTNIINNLK